jgi:hypothetical protein
MMGFPDPSALQRKVNEIMGAPPIITGDSNERALTLPLTEGTEVTSPELAKRSLARRGTTNGNTRGSSADRERRRAWLVDTFRADLDVLVVRLGNGTEIHLDTVAGRGQPACRCYRCGKLLTVDTVTVDRIIPGCQGGTYRRSNIRPACARCNSSTGATKRRKGS